MARTADRARFTGADGTVISALDSTVAAEPLREPDAGDQRQQREIRVSGAQNCEAGALQVVDQLAAAVAADLATELRVVAGQGRQRRDVDQDLSSGPQHPIHLIERVSFHFVVEGVEDVERGHEIEDAGGEGKAAWRTRGRPGVRRGPGRRRVHSK